jgi:hypothetical protein
MTLCPDSGRPVHDHESGYPWAVRCTTCGLSTRVFIDFMGEGALFVHSVPEPVGHSHATCTDERCPVCHPELFERCRGCGEPVPKGWQQDVDYFDSYLCSNCISESMARGDDPLLPRPSRPRS